ncbi:MAG: LacI family DNA-binding transcriptional regulator [Amnibacterium sp.]
MAISVRDVAERAGVSVGTVSNVLNSPGKVAPATTERVLAAIDELGFVRNDAARQLRAGSSRSIGLLVLDVGNPFFTDVARGAEERAQEAGLSVLLANTDQDRRRESAYLDLFEEQRVRGVLITPVDDDVTVRLERLRRHGIPSVLVDRLATSDGFSSVSVDDVAGGRLAAQHLLDTGRRRLLFVGGPRELRQVRDRVTGARQAVEAVAGASLEVMDLPSLTMLDGVSAGRRVVGLDRKPDGVLAVNDLVALGLLQGVGLLGGLRVPEDIAIVGYDDIDFAAAAAVPITSVRQPRDRIGAEALELLLLELEGDEVHRQIVFQPELVVRDSTAVRAGGGPA